MDWFHVQVHIEIENVLKSGVSASSLDYSYGIPTGAKAGEWNNPSEGGRYIHFLRRHGRQFRSVVDFWPSTWRVTSGRHRAVPPGSGLAEQIARLLFTPGYGFQSRSFDLPSAYGHARGLVGWPATLALVQPFATVWLVNVKYHLSENANTSSHRRPLSQMLRSKTGPFRDFCEDCRSEFLGIVERERVVQEAVLLQNLVGANGAMVTPSDPSQRGENTTRLDRRPGAHAAISNTTSPESGGNSP